MFKSKKAQLGVIEMKFFIYGLIVGLVIGIALAVINNRGIVNIPLL
jgi:hypothetical protein